MYKVIRMFTDIQDGGYKYEVGDIYPRDKMVVSDERIKMLSGNENNRGEPVIELVADEKPSTTKKAEKKLSAE
jgi:hypothetical protein